LTYRGWLAKRGILRLNSGDNVRATVPLRVGEVITFHRYPLVGILIGFVCCLTARAGILVLKSEHGIQFAEASSVIINGKDKVLSLGNQPSGSFAKLPAIRPGGILLKENDTGVVAQYDNGHLEYLVPQGLPKGTAEDPRAIWKSVRITYKKSSSDKTGTDVAADSVLAFLPGGTGELARICMDNQALQAIGGKGKTSATQMELMAAVAKQYGADPAVAPMQAYIADAMRSRYQGFEQGGGPDLLKQGLDFVELSKVVYPDQPEQQKLREQLTERNTWLQRKMAVLKSLAAGAQWDTYILADRDFERYEQGYPEMAKLHGEALQQSLDWHLKTAAARKKDGEYGLAFREFHAAVMRKPSDSTLQEEAMQAWTEYSRHMAIEQQSKRTRLGAGPQSTVERDLFFAEQNRQAKKLDESLKNVEAAEAVLKSALPAGSFSGESLKVLYAKAELLAAQDRASEALAALDAYDLMAVDEERANAEKLRNQLLFNLGNNLKSLKGKMQAAWNDGSFALTGQLAAQALRLKPDDADVLYYAGVSALVRRQYDESRDYLKRYLDASGTLDAVPERRVAVNRLLPSIGAPATKAPDSGDANWLSGQKLPRNVFYDPVSLAFQPAIDGIDASGKMHEQFEWAGEKLRSVTPAFDGNEKSTGERKINFAYDAKGTQVMWASDMDALRAAPTDPDVAFRSASVVLPNNPMVDVLALQKLTGKDVTVGVAFNRFFNPFVFEKVHYFRMAYDAQGRAVSARELVGGPGGTPGEQSLEFDWDGMQLTGIRGYVGKSKNYERTMVYQGARLISEDIAAESKPSQIKYTYQGNRLVSADAGKDATLDNRSRKITFRASSPTTVK
jgi:hypothetical protein